MRRVSKYGAIKVKDPVHGVFDSRKEYRRFGELKALEAAGEIRGLQRQPEFRMTVNGKHVCDYRADFAYFEGQVRVIEDVKGFQTAEFKLKKKLMSALYNIDVRIT